MGIQSLIVCSRQSFYLIITPIQRSGQSWHQSVFSLPSWYHTQSANNISRGSHICSNQAQPQGEAPAATRTHSHLQQCCKPPFPLRSRHRSQSASNRLQLQRPQQSGASTTRGTNRNKNTCIFNKINIGMIPEEFNYVLSCAWPITGVETTWYHFPSSLQDGSIAQRFKMNSSRQIWSCSLHFERDHIVRLKICVLYSVWDPETLQNGFSHWK